MIQEDYCSRELAKLLKEKGFDEPCQYFYKFDSDEIYRGTVFTNTQIGEKFYNAPTIQVAMKWLREVHRLYVEVNICMQDSKYYNCIYETVKNGFAYMYDMYEDEITYYDTYEEACEAGIKHCLENIIGRKND